ncbi:hypothetical protein B0H10DRAFT_102655 [Mycena sp. CBHHK59/15]|nr:hypothetical protein B0H10DRAFT_102655 [Mycena sp. CBHHK59/15]
MSSLNITVLDQSPAFIYTPDREGSSSSAWQSSWTGSPDSSYDSKHVQPNIAQGSSSHFTSLAGATVQIQFMGTAVFIYGQGTAGAYSTTLDGGQEVTGTPSGSALASYTDLSNTDKHTILLKVTVAQTLSLSYATFTIDSAVQPNAVVNQTQTAVTLGANNTPFTNAFFTTSGTGPFNNDHSDQNYTRLDTSASDSTFSFAFTNTSVVFVYGTSNYDHQTFSVELDPPVGVSQGARIFNATSKWFVLGNLIYWESGLDQSQKYQVKITNLNSGSYTDIHSVVMMTLPSAEFDIRFSIVECGYSSPISGILLLYRLSQPHQRKPPPTQPPRHRSPSVAVL